MIKSHSFPLEFSDDKSLATHKTAKKGQVYHTSPLKTKNIITNTASMGNKGVSPHQTFKKR